MGRSTPKIYAAHTPRSKPGTCSARSCSKGSIAEAQRRHLTGGWEAGTNRKAAKPQRTQRPEEDLIMCFREPRPSPEPQVSSDLCGLCGFAIQIQRSRVVAGTSHDFEVRCWSATAHSFFLRKDRAVGGRWARIRVARR